MPRKRKAAKPSFLVVQFRWNGRRRTISLRSYRAADVTQINGFVQRIVKAKAAGRDFDRDVCDWLGEISDEVHAKISFHGLVEPRTSAAEKSGPWLGEFLDLYLTRRTDVKGGTKVFYGHTIHNLKEYFGESKPLAEITIGDAHDFRRHLMASKGRRASVERLSPATIARRCSLARTIFRDAVRWRLITDKPFIDMKTGIRSNPARHFFVPVESVEKILQACPNDEWRLLVALSRFGGLRIPSEAFLLRWQDVLWPENRFVVHSPKTEHHEGKATRMVPIFAEMKPYFKKLFFNPYTDGAEFVLPTLARDVSKSPESWRGINLRTQFERIIKRDGVESWPRLWHAMRSSRQTELAQRFPEHVVCKWMGNSRRVADEHYLMVRDEDFASEAEAVTVEPLRAAKSLQPATILGSQQVSSPEATPANQLVLQGLTERDNSRQRNQWAAQDSKNSRGIADSGDSRNSAPAGAPFVPGNVPDAELAELLELWSGLADEGRRAVLATARKES